MYLNKIIKIGWLSSLSLLGLVACKPDPQVPQSEKYVSATKDFKVNSLTPSKPAATVLDFSKDSLKFDAVLSQEVSWTITIKGLSDSAGYAVKTIKGTSATLDPSKVFWDGASDNVYFFKPNEPVDIKVSFLGSDSVITFDSYVVGKTKVFNDKKKAVVVFDFEKTKTDALITNPKTVFMFFDEEGVVSEKIDSAAFVGKEYIANKNSKPLPAPVQGNGCIYMRGKDIVGALSSFYCAGFNGADFNFGLKDEPLDNIYFNFYANSNGNKTTKLVILINGIGGDKFKLERNITWDGWKLVSAKLSDFVLGEAGALGTGKILPTKLKRFNMELHSAYKAGNEVEVLVDYVNFTYGGPFSQSN